MPEKDKILTKEKVTDIHFKIVPAYRTRKDGMIGLMLRFTIGGKQVRININLRVPAAHFKNGRCSGYREAADHNALIGQVLSRAHQIYVDARLGGHQMTQAYFLNRYHNSASRECFYSFMRREIKASRGQKSPGTITVYDSTLKKLQEYRPECSFADLSYDFVKDFDRWLSQEKKNTVSTVAKAHKTVKTFIKEAIRCGVKIQNPYEQFSYSKGKNRIDYLALEELEKLTILYDSHQIEGRLQNVLQCFLFSCFTGLRMSDLQAITRENIVDDTLVFNQQKNGRNSKTISLPLSTHALRYISKTGDILPRISAQKMNQYIKEVAAFAGITRNVTFHLARHTFAPFAPGRSEYYVPAGVPGACENSNYDGVRASRK